METQIEHTNGSGNWIAFLFGAVFNVFANVGIDEGVYYLKHAIVGGVVCLFFKMIGDLFTPLLHRFGVQLKEWFYKIDEDQN